MVNRLIYNKILIDLYLCKNSKTLFMIEEFKLLSKLSAMI